MTARQAVPILVLLVVLLLAWWGMRAGWVHRRRRTEAAVPAVPAVPADLGPALVGPFDAVYVSTTTAGDWLDRVVAHDLGVRSPAEVAVHASGVVVRRTGARDLFVPAAALRAAGVAPGIAGKVVGRDGIVVLTWLPPAPRTAPDDTTPDGTTPDDATPDGTTPDAHALDTGILPRHAADRDALVAAAAALIDPSPSDTPAARGTQEKP